jgi:hypothetical protein
MIPFSTNARPNLDFPVVKGYNLSGLFLNIWVLSFFSLIVLFAFMPPPAAVQGNSNLDQSQGSDQSGVHHSVAFPAGQPIKKRKAPLVRSPAGQSNGPVTDENTSLISSVSVPKAFSYTVIQQPEDNPYYVSSSKYLVTEFGLARKYGTIGLLAHNNLAGKSFKRLNLDQEINIVQKDGHPDRYIVSAIYRFQALDSTNTESRFVDLDSKETLTATELFNKMYTGGPHLTFQTCIYARGDPSWGRLFVIAMPAAETQ